jgi:hypothetical protein
MVQRIRICTDSFFLFKKQTLSPTMREYKFAQTSLLFSKKANAESNNTPRKENALAFIPLRISSAASVAAVTRALDSSLTAREAVSSSFCSADPSSPRRLAHDAAGASATCSIAP